MDIDLSALLNGLAGIAALVVALTLRPAIKDLRTLVRQHEGRLDSHDVRLAKHSVKLAGFGR